MTVFTVHVTPEDAETAEKAVFVPEGFSWGAFFFAPLWLLWHRLWLSFLLWCAGMLCVIGATSPLSPARGGAYVLIALLCGFEGWQWVRQKLARQGKAIVDLVTGDSEADAETHFYHRGTWQIPDPMPSSSVLPRAPRGAVPAGAASEVPFGLFPEPENRL